MKTAPRQAPTARRIVVGPRIAAPRGQHVFDVVDVESLSANVVAGELVESDRHRRRQSGSCAQRVGGDRSCPIGIAQVIDVDAAGARVLARSGREQRRCVLHQAHGQRPRKPLRLGPRMATRDRQHEVEPLASGRLDEAPDPELVEQRTHAACGVLECCPRQPGIRIEIERDPVGTVESRKARAPRVEFEAAVLHGTYDVSDVGEAHERGRTVLFVVAATRRVLLEKAVVEPAAHAFDDGDRTGRQLREQPLADALVVANDVELRVRRSFDDRPLGMTDVHAGDERRRGGLLLDCSAYLRHRRGSSRPGGGGATAAY